MLKDFLGKISHTAKENDKSFCSQLCDTIGHFFHTEAGSGVLLVFFAALALIVANSPLHAPYSQLLHHTTGIVGIGELVIEKPIELWINDGLMAVFFFLIGLEVKREMMEGLLSTWSQRLLPGIAAIGGMVAPAIIYVLINSYGDDPAGTLSGWAIPSATDIAFAIGVYALVGKYLPPSLKILLLALAIFDDLGAIIIIALFYSSGLDVGNLYLAAIFFAGLALLNFFNVRRVSLYLVLGLGMWVCVLKSGVHATLAGVVLAFMIPLNFPGERRSMLRQLQSDLHPFVNFVILPLFALANAGVYLGDVSLNIVFAPVTLGIALGLFIGKPVGITFAVWLAIKLGLSRMPLGAHWGHIIGVSWLAGIGFTMSLFIGTLAFDGPLAELYRTETKLGIILGSLLSAICGAVYIYLLSERARRKQQLAGATAAE